MSEQQPKTITCPSCGNVNPYMADECIKCGLALGPIREAMGKAGAPEAVGAPPTPAKPKEPAPPMPELPKRPTTEKPSHFQDSWRFLIRGMGNRAEEIAARFFQKLAERGIEGLSLALGSINIDLGGGRKDSRDYYFAERDLDQDAAATMAVRIAPTGKDLFVEWRHYTTPPLGAFASGTFWGITVIAIVIAIAIGATAESFGLFVVVALGGMGIAAAAAAGKARKYGLEGFQEQDSTAFQLSVRAALEEAIDDAGISKVLVQDLPKEGSEERRVI